MTEAGAPSPLDRVRAFLSAPRCAILATLDAGGSPHQAVVHYWIEADALLVNGRADRRWVANLRRETRVAVAVHDADEPEHWVGLKGDATLARSGPAAVEDAMALARRYAGDPDEYAAQERVSFRLVPRRVYEYGRAAQPGEQPATAGEAVAIASEGFSIRPVGVVRSPLRSRAQAPRQPSEGAPAAVLELDPALADALGGIEPGAEMVVLTWLHQADRSVRRTHPRGEMARPLAGVFATRSPDRPNPIGLHRVRVVAVDGCRLSVDALEAIDGTPIVDLKPEIG